MDTMIEKFPGLVDAIKHGIIKIRESFARPCCKKILNHVQRSGVNVDMDDFKIVLGLMIVNNIITRKVTKKGESFYVNNPLMILMNVLSTMMRTMAAILIILI